MERTEEFLAQNKCSINGFDSYITKRKELKREMGRAMVASFLLHRPSGSQPWLHVGITRGTFFFNAWSHTPRY